MEYELNIKDEIVFLLQSTKREGIEDLIDDMIANGFFDAPASISHHLNHKGGLAQHSYTVYKALHKLNIMFNLGLNNDTIIITALLHDICKMDDYKWDDNKKEFTKNPSIILGHGEKSVYMITRYIKLSIFEALMIRWHMGNFTAGFDRDGSAAQKKYPKCMSLFFADYLATLYMESD